MQVKAALWSSAVGAYMAAVAWQHVNPLLGLAVGITFGAGLTVWLRRGRERERTRRALADIEDKKRSAARRAIVERAFTHERRTAAVDGLTDVVWSEIRAQWQNQCAYCGAELGDAPIHREHVYPLHRGGQNTADNIVPSCAQCNISKGTSTGPEYIARRKRQGQAVNADWQRLKPPALWEIKGTPTKRPEVKPSLDPEILEPARELLARDLDELIHRINGMSARARYRAGALYKSARSINRKLNDVEARLRLPLTRIERRGRSIYVVARGQKPANDI